MPIAIISTNKKDPDVDDYANGYTKNEDHFNEAILEAVTQLSGITTTDDCIAIIRGIFESKDSLKYPLNENLSIQINSEHNEVFEIKFILLNSSLEDVRAALCGMGLKTTVLQRRDVNLSLALLEVYVYSE